MSARQKTQRVEASASSPSVSATAAWLTWSLGALFFCYSFFQRVAPSVMIDPLMRDLAIGGAVLGNLSAFYFYAYAGLQIPIGLMVDRWGARILLTLGAALCALGSLCFALGDSLAAVYIGRLMIGAGAGCSFVSTLKLATAWFPPARFAQLTGMTMMLGMLGGIFGQAPLAILVEDLGWRGALMGAAAVGAVLAALIWVVVRDTPASQRPRADRVVGGPSIAAALVLVLGRPRNWALALISAAMTAPLLAFAGLWGVAWLMQVHGLPRSEAAANTSLLLIGWAVGSPLAGTFSDRLKMRKWPLLAGASLGLSALAIIIYVPAMPPAVLALLLFVCGFSCGSVAISFAIARETNDAQLGGMALAFINMSVVGSGALFQPLIGALLDWQWGGQFVDGARVYGPEAYRIAFSVLILFLLLGILAGLTIRDSRADDPSPSPNR